MSDQNRAMIRAFMRKYIRAAEFSDDQNIFESGFVNSLFAMQLILFIESSFDLAVEGPDLKIANFSSVDAVSAFVAAKRGAETPS